MILPTKRLSEERSLLNIGALILSLLDEPKTVSRIWDDLNSGTTSPSTAPIVFDWFVLALDLLHAIGAIDLERGRLRKAIR